MTWARLDDGFWRNPKIEALNDRQFRLYVAAISYAADQLTDGIIDPKAMRYLALSCSLARPGAVAKSLLSAELWVSEGDCYRINDYLDYNPSKADVQAKRAATAERVKRHRNAVTNTVTNAVGNTVGNAGPDPALEEQPLKVGSSRDRSTGAATPQKATPPPVEGIGRKPNTDDYQAPTATRLEQAEAHVRNALWQDPHRKQHLADDYPDLTPTQLDELDQLGNNLEQILNADI